MLINKDFDSAHQVRIKFRNAEVNRVTSFAGPVVMITFGKAQYQWHPNRKQGYADPDNPPVTSTLAANEETLYNLPAASLNVVRGNLIAVTGP